MHLPEPHVSRDSFFHQTSLSRTSPPTTTCPVTIYFITGNPGLISYYHSFLSHLSQKLASNPNTTPETEKPSSIHIFGHSLAGFELEQSPKPKGRDGDHYYSLEEQICFVQDRLRAHTSALGREYADADASSTSGPSRPKVILIGHSVGTYMAMEILRRHREELAPIKAQDPSRSENGFADGDRHDDEAGSQTFDIIGGIMLFPTVMDIAQSPSGQKLTFLLRIIPQLALVVSVLARILTSLLSTPILRTLVRFVMSSPPPEAVDATVSFLRSRRGVRQALHMAADEMRTITTDKWSDDVWGVSRVKEPLTRMFFYFGRNDHWVAERTREEIIALKGRKETKMKSGPRMIVCEEALPHAFCLRHSEVMATKVAGMVAEILR
ncbi:bifunctional triacylglycerol lipase/ester hydrolase [Aspergillus lucknowensis]|uniref:Lipid droplet-associated hydrolase n=1 Tax=Aspergillus lucknowensis TaxID=176173 RepID=A0ABR4LCK1_9EURO